MGARSGVVALVVIVAVLDGFLPPSPLNPPPFFEVVKEKKTSPHLISDQGTISSHQLVFDTLPVILRYISGTQWHV